MRFVANAQVRKMLRTLLVLGLVTVLCSGVGASGIVHAQEGGPTNGNLNNNGPSIQSGGKILLVDDDNNTEDPDAVTYYTSVLAALGKTYDPWDTNNSDVEPGTLDLANYNIVIWFTGNSSGSSYTGPGIAGANALKTWLDGGGCLFLSSMDFHYAKSHSSFPILAPYLGVSDVYDDVGQSSVTGAGSIFHGLGSYTLSYPPEYDDYSDGLVPDSTAESAFEGTAYTAAVDKDSGVYRTLYMAFPFEAFGSLANRQQVMSTFLNWCAAGNQTLTVSTTGLGKGKVTSSPPGIDCGSACSQSFAYNTTVALTPEPDSSTYKFTGWSGACTGSGSCSVVMNADKSVTANFEFTNPTISVKDVYTADENGLTASPGNMPQLQTGDVHAAAIKTIFNPGDPIQLSIVADSQFPETHLADFLWVVLDPLDQHVVTLESSTDNIPVDSGLSTWSVTGTVPLGSPGGEYTFYGYITFGGTQTFDSSIFHVTTNAIMKVYLPLLIRNY